MGIQVSDPGAIVLPGAACPAFLLGLCGRGVPDPVSKMGYF